MGGLANSAQLAVGWLGHPAFIGKIELPGALDPNFVPSRQRHAGAPRRHLHGKLAFRTGVSTAAALIHIFVSIYLYLE
jgi:hypothetical protein